jgi:hypothetical protein
LNRRYQVTALEGGELVKDIRGEMDFAGLAGVAGPLADQSLSAAALMAAFEQFHRGLLLVDPELHIRFANQGERRILARSDALSALTVSGIRSVDARGGKSPGVHPWSSPAMAAWSRAWCRMCRDRLRVLAISRCWRRADGSESAAEAGAIACFRISVRARLSGRAMLARSSPEVMCSNLR